jgi:hypothetical protein
MNAFGGRLVGSKPKRKVGWACAGPAALGLSRGGESGGAPVPPLICAFRKTRSRSKSEAIAEAFNGELRIQKTKMKPVR